MVYAVGDIHGRHDLLLAALRLIEHHAGTRSATVVFLGDYIDRGPESRAVVETIMAGPRREGDEFIALKGNHEAMMVDAHEQEHLVASWLMNGGVQTLESYHGEVPNEHLSWMKSLPVLHQTEHHVFVHAGLRPGVPIAEQREEEMLWIRGLFLNWPEAFEKHVVHGHTPLNYPDLRPNRTNLDSGAFWTGKLSIGVFDQTQAGGPLEVLTATTPYGEGNE